MNQSAVGTTERIPSAVPTGLGFLHYAFPALKRWAKLFRPASGAPAWEPRTTFLFRPMMNNPKRWAFLFRPASGTGALRPRKLMLRLRLSLVTIHLSTNHFS